jgi:hypothetical protein
MLHNAHLLDWFRESGGQKQHLAVRSNVAQNAHDLWLKAEVKHAVSFVYYDKSDTAQVGYTTSVRSKHVNHAARCTNDDIRATLQLCNLH